MNSDFRFPNSETVRPSKWRQASSAFGWRDGVFTRHSSFVLRIFALLALFSFSPMASACSVCFGGTDSQLSRGMLAGVLVLLLVVLSVLGGFVVLFVYLARRAAATAALENQSTAPDSIVNS